MYFRILEPGYPTKTEDTTVNNSVDEIIDHSDKIFILFFQRND
jgi:hypothetical protein